MHSSVSIVLPKKVNMNLSEKPEDKMIEFHPSATQTGNTRGNKQQGHYSLHSSVETHVGLFVCACLSKSSPSRDFHQGKAGR